ncbi:hypothetical protein SAMN04487975_11344 [Planococcus glaciei]|nr:hypothetical protein SAMN04487975_11344 [Planococcus glaciei]
MSIAANFGSADGSEENATTSEIELIKEVPARNPLPIFEIRSVKVKIRSIQQKYAQTKLKYAQQQKKYASS